MVFAISIALLCLLSSANAGFNRLIRVDGINPTCFRRNSCKEYDIVGAVINVDKSLPYMGSNYCCIRFHMADEVSLSEYEEDAFFIGRILNSTYLEGDDFITFFEDDFKLVKNVTAFDLDPYKIIYFNSPNVIVEFYKDRSYRSRYEILLSIYFKGKSPKCKKSNQFRCGTNTSICIDEDLTCDKFPHCPDENDEEICGSMHETSMVYDKATITIVLGMMVSFIGLTTLLIFLLCLCKSQQKLTNMFMSIFGYKSKSKNSEMLEGSNLFRNIKDQDQRFNLINEKA